MADEHKTIAKGAFWGIFSQIGIRVIGFFYLILLARFVDPAEAGAFYLGLSIVGVVYTITDFGLVYSNTRYVPYLYGRKEIGKLKWLVRNSYMFGGILTLLVSIAISLFAKEILVFANQPQSVEPALRLLAFWLILQEIFDISRGVLNGRKMVKESQILELLQNVVKITALGAFIYLGFTTAEHVSLSYLISFLFVLPFGLFYVYRIYKGLKPSKEEEQFNQVGFGKEVLAFGIVMMSTLLLNVIVQNIDKVMIGSFMGEAGLDDITVYSFAAAISNLIAIVPVAIATIFLPLASEKIGEKKEELKEITDLSTKWIIMGSLPVMIVFAVFSKDILGMIYGSLYESGAFMLSVLAIGIFIRCVAIPAGNSLAALRKVEIEFIITAIAAIVNVGLNLFLIPEYGADGAAFASAIALTLSALMVVYYYVKITGMKLEFEWKGLLLAGVLAGLITVGLKPLVEPLFKYTVFTVYENSEFYILFLNKVVKAGVLAGVCALTFGLYVAGLILSKSFGRHEIEVIQGIMERLKLPKKLIIALVNILNRT